ncbi:MAG TPA: penicillin-binding transpeptidase domain-containing protein, partial [Chitinophagales bacterium]|nr:penicillin-binding transpeptidase domain-containing protein [Chitinophagales bacterium]
WLQKINNANLFPEQDIADALVEPLEMKRHAVPRLAPHLAQRMRRAYPREPIVRATVSPAMQVQTENIVFNYVQRLQGINVTNAAVLVIDNETQRVLAYCGSADFYNAFNQGQVDGVRAVRSPGSTLKPFLYALCFDRGLATPLMHLDDVPCDYDGYKPKNFDNRYNGSVTVEQALSRSLNVPAVELMNRLGARTFSEQLARVGFRDFQRRKELLGLSAILGGCGVTLEELVTMYAMFANGGEQRRIQWTTNTADSFAIRGCSPSAAYMVTRTLTQLTRPDLPNNFSSSFRLPKIAWKTGTSYGRRDAWSIGYNDRYTVGVWVGNFDGTGVPELTGADVATPLLFELFNTIDYNGSASLRQPQELDVRTVCGVSGLPPHEFCNDLVTDFFIPGVSTNTLCQHAKHVPVSSDERESYCTHCKPETGYITKLYPNFSPGLLAYYDAQQLRYDRIPAHNASCSQVQQGAAPAIVSPTANTEYLLEKKGSKQIRLACHAANDVSEVYWYVNDMFYKSTKPFDALFFEPGSSGQFKISCADDKGRNADVRIQVTML